MDAMAILKRENGNENVPKGDGIGFKIVHSVERPKQNWVPLFKRAIYRVFDEECIHCRQVNELFAICTCRELISKIPLNFWTNDYNINCKNCKFHETGEKKSLMWISNESYRKYILKYYTNKIKFMSDNLIENNFEIVKSIDTETRCTRFSYLGYVKLFKLPYRRIRRKK